MGNDHSRMAPHGVYPAAGEDRWLWRTSMWTHKHYQGDWPEDGAFDIGNGVGYAGSVPMALDRHIFYGYYGESYKRSQVNKFRHYFENGLFVGEFGELGANVGYLSYSRKRNILPF